MLQQFRPVFSHSHFENGRLIMGAGSEFRIQLASMFYVGSALRQGSAAFDNSQYILRVVTLAQCRRTQAGMACLPERWGAKLIAPPRPCLTSKPAAFMDCKNVFMSGGFSDKQLSICAFSRSWNVGGLLSLLSFCHSP